MRNLIIALLVVAFTGACRQVSPPAIDTTFLPTFDAVFVCDVEVSNHDGIPDSLRIDRDCVPIDDSAFRKFVLQAAPSDEASWKGGRLVVGRSESAGDRYFFISNYGGFFERPGVRGTYVVPEAERAAWDALILRKSSQ